MIPESVFIVTIIVSLLVQATELFLLKLFIQYSVRKYAEKVFVPAALVMLVSAIIPFILEYMMQPSMYRFLAVGFASVVSVLLSVYVLGIDAKTRSLVEMKIKNFLKKRRVDEQQNFE
jgi:uncharacterized membrane protein